MGLNDNFRGPSQNYLMVRGEHKYSFEPALFHFKTEIHTKTGFNGGFETRHRPDTEKRRCLVAPFLLVYV